MKRFVVLFLMLVLFSACQSNNSSGVGNGVKVALLNAHDLSEVYVPIVDDTRPTGGAPPGGNSDLALAFTLSTLVHNTGYADTVVAQYISGYDPNLFVVEAAGPYARNYDQHYCYKDAILTHDFNYNVNVLCAAAEDVWVGGGVYGNDGTSGGVFTIYLENIRQWLLGQESSTNSELGTFLRFLGIENVHFTCEGRSTPSGDGRDFSTQCVLNWGIRNYLLRSSRGTIALALYGADIRNCGNGCTVIPAPPRGYLAGDQDEFPGGEQTYLDYRVYLDRSRWPANLNEHNQLFQIDTCSLYTTYVTPEVCVDATPGSQDSEVCRPGPAVISSYQAAPVKVTSVVSAMQGPRVVFSITVQQDAPGQLLSPGSADLCAPGAPQSYVRQQENVLEIVDARLVGSLNPLECVNDYKIRLKDGVGKTTCSYTLPPTAQGRPAYQTTLNLEIAYMHRQTQTVPVSLYRI